MFYLDVDPLGKRALMIKHAKKAVVGQGVARGGGGGARAEAGLDHVRVATLQHLGSFYASKLCVGGGGIEGGEVPEPVGKVGGIDKRSLYFRGGACYLR